MLSRLHTTRPCQNNARAESVYVIVPTVECIAQFLPMYQWTACSFLSFNFFTASLSHVTSKCKQPISDNCFIGLKRDRNLIKIKKSCKVFCGHMYERQITSSTKTYPLNRMLSSGWKALYKNHTAGPCIIVIIKIMSK